MKSLTKSELAWKYCPEVTQNAALNRLSRWIKGDEELHNKLLATGYSDRQHILTSKQVELIYDYIGEP